jgi:hypothetical protein
MMQKPTKMFYDFQTQPFKLWRHEDARPTLEAVKNFAKIFQKWAGPADNASVLLTRWPYLKNFLWS